MPCIRHLPDKGDVYVDTGDTCPNSLADFYEKYLAAEASDDWSAFAISPDHASGIYAFRDYLVDNNLRPKIAKISSRGPMR